MDPMGGPPPGMDDGFDDGGGFDDMGPPGGPGGGSPGDMGGGGGGGGAPSKPVNVFNLIMLLRKMLSIVSILTVIGLEASLAVQDAQLKTLAPVLKPMNKFSKRDIVHTGLILATQKKPKIDCEYYSGFDVPAVKAGQARSVIYHILNCIGLLGLLWLERPSSKTTAETLACSTIAAPPVGNVGLFTFGLLQIWLGTSVLNHFVGTFTYISAFVLVVAGIMSLLFSILFISKLKRASTAGAGGDAMGGGMGPPMGGPPPMFDDGF